MNDKDYSNPVGWWCTECGHDVGAGGCYEHSLAVQIPIFEPLPIPEPCVIDEMPDVVTVVDGGLTPVPIYCTPDVILHGGDGLAWAQRMCVSMSSAAAMWVAEGGPIDSEGD